MQTEQRAEKLSRDSQNGHRWGVILPGGDGKRLLPLTHKITGDDRPKQFCNVMDREKLGYALTEFHSELVILLGNAPEGLEAGYGWIEPGPALSNPLPVCARRVSRFRVKPSQAMVSTLLERGCLWNSFVMVGHVGAFIELVRRTLPKLLASIESLRPSLNTVAAEDELADLHSEISTADFAHEALSVRPDDLTVLCGFGLGWNDLGEPRRVLSARSQHPTQTT